MADFTLLDETRPLSIPRVEREAPGVWLDADALERTLGWTLKPEGLCQGDVCIPVRDRSFVADQALELGGLAKALGRPLATNVEAGAAALGTAAASRASSLASLEAPEFCLPDLGGSPHRLSAYRGKKVLLIAYSSW